jgi:hypothetical protein
MLGLSIVLLRYHYSDAGSGTNRTREGTVDLDPHLVLKVFVLQVSFRTLLRCRLIHIC